MSRALLLVAVPILLVACTGSMGGDESMAPPSDPHEGLSLITATPDELDGTYTREGVSVSFVATPDSFLLYGASGRTLVDAKTTSAGKEMLLMDGAVTFTEASTYHPSPRADRGMQDFVTSEEGKILPWLSFQLGELGITGTDYPSSFMIHSFAITMAQANSITLPPMPEKARSGINPQDNYGGNGAWCQAYSMEWGSSCYGMCGPGCTCWHWVCGDCCNHYGCAHHDDACRTCSWSHPAACAACASFSAFFTGGGCSHP
jgi:hypothetical protein